MSVVKGLDVLIKVGGQVVGGQRNASIELSSETIDTTTKQSNGWSTKVAGTKSWTSSCDGVYFVDDAGIQAVYTAFENGSEVELEFSSTSGVYHKGTCVISSISEESGMDDVTSYTMAFEGTGALTNSK